MRYAPIYAWDSLRKEWAVIGVIATSSQGARLRIMHAHPLVRQSASLSAMELHNEDLAQGEVSYYGDIEPGMTGSSVQRLKTTDPNFIEKYGEAMAIEGKWLRLGKVQKQRGANIEKALPGLLTQIFRAERMRN